MGERLISELGFTGDREREREILNERENEREIK